jgi:L-lactate dehydrogenase (cytochrome)
MSQEFLQKYPAISDLRARAKRRVPHFAWEFLESGTGADAAMALNEQAFARVHLNPRFVRGAFEPELETELFGTRYAVPFGICPVGMNSLIWPGMDKILATAAARHRLPYGMSTAANETPETLGPLAAGMGWFQLYPPRNPNMRTDMLSRAREAGFTTLMVTVDVPVMSRRERQIRAGVGAGFKLSPATLWQLLRRPEWSLAMLAEGRPGLPTLEQYLPTGDLQRFLSMVGSELNGTFDWDYLDAVRSEWGGPLILKGIMDPDDAREAVRHGVDGILVSNHGGRQMDAAPASIEMLPVIADAIGGEAKLLLDSGVRSGLDIARAIALGADFVMLGRAFMYGVAALGPAGAAHTIQILADDLRVNMGNLGCATLTELRERLVRH